MAISQPKMVRLPRNEKKTHRLNSRPQMWPLVLTLPMNLTLNFQGQIWNWLYLSATKRKANISIEHWASNVTNGFDLGHDLDIWIFKVKCDLADLVTKVRCKDLPEWPGDFRCQRAIDSSSYIYDFFMLWFIVHDGLCFCLLIALHYGQLFIMGLFLFLDCLMFWSIVHDGFLFLSLDCLMLWSIVHDGFCFCFLTALCFGPLFMMGFVSVSWLPYVLVHCSWWVLFLFLDCLMFWSIVHDGFCFCFLTALCFGPLFMMGFVSVSWLPCVMVHCSWWVFHCRWVLYISLIMACETIFSYFMEW